MDTINPSSWKFWSKRRHFLTIMIFFGFFTTYSIRANMSIAIVAMTSGTSITKENGTEVYVDAEFFWDNKLQGYLFSSFFYGHITTQLLGGVLSKKFGGKWIFGGGIASTAFITIISPWLAEWSIYVLMIGRVLMGVSEGLAFSSVYTLYSKWVPPQERSRVGGQVTSGNYIGIVFALMFLGFLTEVAGWRSIFWVSGSLGLIWFAFWAYFISEFPEQDSRISETELHYIQQSLSVEAESPKATSIRSIKWKKILSSKAVWALNIGLFCESWGFFTLLTLLPKYFKDIYDFDISKPGMVSALPYLGLAVMVHVSGQMADRILLRNWLSVTQIRKTFVAIGFLSQTCFMLGAMFWENAIGTVFCFTMAIGLGSMAITAIIINPLDIAVLNSSIVFGLFTTCGTISGILSPIAAGYLISTTNPTVEEWRIVFYITAGLYLLGAIIFTTFASGTRQSWDYSENEMIDMKDFDKNNAIRT